MNFFGRIGWPATFFIPVFLGIAVALWGLNSSLPRAFFIVAFLFVLVVLPGVFIYLKIIGTPIEEQRVTVLGTTTGNRVRLMLDGGHVDSLQDGSLFTAVNGGKIKSGTVIRIARRGDLVINWQPIRDNVDPA